MSDLDKKWGGYCSLPLTIGYVDNFKSLTQIYDLFLFFIMTGVG